MYLKKKKDIISRIATSKFIYCYSSSIFGFSKHNISQKMVKLIYCTNFLGTEKLEKECATFVFIIYKIEIYYKLCNRKKKCILCKKIKKGGRLKLHIGGKISFSNTV